MSRSKHPLSRQWNDLHDAAEKGEASESELKQLLTRFNVDVRSPDLGTALHNAARKGNTETVNFLLGAGANPDVQNNHGETPLHEAAQMGRTETVQLLLKKGANPDAQNKRWETPLHLVAYWSFGDPHIASMVRLLLKYANPNLQTSEGDTPLYSHIRSPNPRTDVVHVLAPHTNVDALTKALALAIQMGDDDDDDAGHSYWHIARILASFSSTRATEPEPRPFWHPDNSQQAPDNECNWLTYEQGLQWADHLSCPDEGFFNETKNKGCEAQATVLRKRHRNRCVEAHRKEKERKVRLRERLEVENVINNYEEWLKRKRPYKPTTLRP